MQQNNNKKKVRAPETWRGAQSSGISSATQHLPLRQDPKEKKPSASRAGVLSTGDENKDEVMDVVDKYSRLSLCFCRDSVRNIVKNSAVLSTFPHQQQQVCVILN